MIELILLLLLVILIVFFGVWIIAGVTLVLMGVLKIFSWILEKTNIGPLKRANDRLLAKMEARRNRARAKIDARKRA